MFEKELAEKFNRIFKVPKVTYNTPGESGEQKCLFIEIESSNNRIKNGRATARVTGNGYIICQAEEIPFGFISKAIAKADPADTYDLMFFDIESNTQRYQNLVQRQFSFIYFFDGQYDPDTGSITSIEYFFTEEQ